MRSRAVVELPEVFRGADAVAAGVLTPADLRSGSVTRVLRGVYRPSGTRPSHLTACRAVALVAPEDAVLTGASALTVHGVPLRRASDPVHVVVPPHSRFTLGDGIVVGHRTVRPDEAVAWEGARLATVGRACLDLVLGRAPAASVPDLDQVLRAGLVGPAELRSILAGRTDRGIVAARRAVDLADGRAESPPESWVRVVLTEAGLTPEPQVVITDGAGHFVARVDLGFRAQRVAVEYEGAWHGDPGALSRDRDRLNLVREQGWAVVFVTAADRHRPVRELVDRVRLALGVTLVPPPSR